MSDTVELIFASWPDEEHLVAEVSAAGDQIAYVRRIDDVLFITLISQDSERTVPLADFLAVLDRANERLQ